METRDAHLSTYQAARQLIKLGNLQKAREMLEPLVQEGVPGSKSLFGYALLKSASDEQSTERALATLKEVVDDEGDENAARQLAHYYHYKARNFDEAMACYAKLVNMGAWEANYQIGKIIAAIGRETHKDTHMRTQDPQMFFEKGAQNGYIFSILEVKKAAARKGIAYKADYLFNRFLKLPFRLAAIAFSDPDDRRIRR